MEYIVFAIDHYNALGIIRGLGEDGIEVNAIIVKAKIRFVPYSRYIKNLIDVKSIDEGYKILLDTFKDNSTKYAILGGDDTVISYLDAHYNEIKDRFLFFNAGFNGKLSKYMDKKCIDDLAKSVGFLIPHTWKVKKHTYPDDIEYPIITKSESPVVGGWKSDVFVCNNQKELEEAYRKVKSDNVVLQQYIKKDNELALQGYAINNGQDIFISVATNNAFILPDKYCSYIKVFKFNNDLLQDKCRKLLALIGYNGIFEIEFMEAQGKLYFLEVNFRNTAFNYASKYAGENLNKTWPLALVKGEIVKDKGIKDDLNFTVMAEPQDFQDRVRNRRISLFQWLRELRRCDCLFYYNKTDKKPWLMYWKNRLFKKRK